MTLPDGPLIVGVCGAGTMGAGIVQVCLGAGHEVVLYDVDPAAIERGRGRIAEGLDRLVSRDRLAAEDRDAMLASLREARTLEEVAGQADVVIEAALEDLELKRSIFIALAGSTRPDSILATNTSALSVTAIAETAAAPQRILGLHFFNPAPLMALVEVVAGRQTADDTLDRAVAFVAGLGKTPVICRDAPGFIVNRVNRPFTLEALRMLESGDAGIEDIDRAVVGAGYPMGPLALMDLVGIDVNFAVASALYEASDRAIRFAPSPIQQALVEAGRLGRKTGEGFYRYAEGRPAGLSSGLADAGVVAPSWPALDSAEIVSRIESAIINEAYRAAGEGVADPPDIDRAMKLGANHPHGPFERAGQLGLGKVVGTLARFEATLGERYAVAPMLWQMAAM